MDCLLQGTRRAVTVGACSCNGLLWTAYHCFPHALKYCDVEDKLKSKVANLPQNRLVCSLYLYNLHSFTLLASNTTAPTKLLQVGHCYIGEETWNIFSSIIIISDTLKQQKCDII